jgi:sec-independent protein translocase protein TatA
MFGRIGASELLLILAVVLIFFGPQKLPALAKSMGQAVSEFRKGTKEISKEFEELAKDEDEASKESK